jgi:NAD(P)-dependent dehydrogenase (short-subunit alcohol dehydrogenase family)
VPPAFLSVYAASRGAQNAWVKAIGLELAPFNINVNAVAQENVGNNFMRSGVGGTRGQLEQAHQPDAGQEDGVG